jgi:hypothetical protein
MTVFSSRNMQDQPMDTEVEVVEEDIEDEETTTSEEVEETPTKESKDGTENTTESPIDGQTSEDDETDTSEEETPEEKPEILPDIDIELTDEEKALVFKYIGKVDMEYLMSLSSDGISEDENILIIDHLKERLTEEEYGEVEGLIIRFLYSIQQ